MCLGWLSVYAVLQGAYSSQQEPPHPPHICNYKVNGPHSCKGKKAALEKHNQAGVPVYAGAFVYVIKLSVV